MYNTESNTVPKSHNRHKDFIDKLRRQITPYLDFPNAAGADPSDDDSCSKWQMTWSDEYDSDELFADLDNDDI